MQVFAVQYDIEWENRDANIERVTRLLAEAAPPEGSLIVLPEMAFTGFSMTPAKVADTDKAETEQAIRSLAKNHRSWVLGGMVSRAEDGRGRNTALLADPQGEPAAAYCKIHPFSPTGEHRRYVAGDDVVVAACGGFTLAPFVCYDLRFPEIFRTAARRGANLIAVVANWPAARFSHWQALLRARAIENQAWVVGVNRCGSDPRFEYPGGTTIIAPDGEVVVAAGDEETVVQAEVTLERVADLRERFPVLKDMRESWTRG